MKIKFLLWYVFFSLWLMGCRDAESAIDYKQNVSVRLSMDAATTRGVSALPAVGLIGIWWAVPIGWILADTTGVIYYLRIKKSVHQETLV